MGRSIVNRPMGLDGDCISPRKGGSTPYYQFGTQRKYAYAWTGGPGGVPQGVRAAETRELGMDVLDESGLNPYSMASPAFSRTSLHTPPETLGLFDGLSNNEKKLATVAVAAGIGFFLWKRSKKGRRR